VPVGSGGTPEPNKFSACCGRTRVLALVVLPVLVELVVSVRSVGGGVICLNFLNTSDASVDTSSL
jgi:hypothetical protein